MSTHVHFALFLIITCAFVFVGFWSGRKHRSARSYFRDSSLNKHAVSLTASNITLGTGLVYLIAGAEQLGSLMLVVPWALFFGYYVLGRLVTRASSFGIGSGKNLLADMSDRIADATGYRCNLAGSVSAVLAVLMVVLLAFETFASAKVLTPLLLGTHSLRAEIVISTLLFAITIAYTILGGVKAILAVDFLQVPVILFFLPAFAWVAVFSHGGLIHAASTVADRTFITTPVLMALGSAVINAFVGQFFSLLNIGALSQVEARDRQRLTNRVGVMTALVLSIFILAGLSVTHLPSESGWEALMERITTTAESGVVGLVLSSAIVLGMTSVMLTTTDAVVFNAIMFWYDNVAGGDSTRVDEDPKSIRRVRLIGCAVFTSSFCVLGLLNFFQPSPFYFLIGLAGGINVIAPAIVLALFLSERRHWAAAFTTGVLRFFVGLLALACAGNSILVLCRPQWVASFSGATFLLSVVFAAVVWVRRNRPVG